MKKDENINLKPEELRQKLNLETGQLAWHELARSFARGVVVVTDSSMDLIEVAVALAVDNKAQFEDWVAKGKVWRATDEDAKSWHANNQLFWSVVIPPWVLVQGVNEPEDV